MPHGPNTGTLWTSRTRQKHKVVRKSPEHNLLTEAKAQRPGGDHQQRHKGKELRKEELLGKDSR